MMLRERWLADLGVPTLRSPAQRRGGDGRDKPEPAVTLPMALVPDRAVSASQVVSYVDNRAAAIELVASALYKMAHSPVERGRLLAAASRKMPATGVRLTTTGWSWTQLSVDTPEAALHVKPGVLPDPSDELILLSSLFNGGRGTRCAASERVWLAATRAGAMCVVKFPRDAADVTALKLECDLWHRVWGRTDVRLQRLPGGEPWQDALVMPYVHMLTTWDVWDAPTVAAAHIAAARVAAMGYGRMSVCWDRAGKYIDEDGLQHVVFVGLLSVVAQAAGASSASGGEPEPVRDVDRDSTPAQLARP